MARIFRHIYVVRQPAPPRRGILVAGPLRVPVALGRSGLVTRKREGDGGTPRGRMPLRRVWYRADRVGRPKTALPTIRTARYHLWSDDPRDHRYNRPVRPPHSFSHEEMWRADGLYDYIVELGWNDSPPLRGRGSAIFMHIARDGFKPTEGCIALRRRDLRRLLPHLGPGTMLIVR